MGSTRNLGQLVAAAAAIEEAELHDQIEQLGGECEDVLWSCWIWMAHIRWGPNLALSIIHLS